MHACRSWMQKPPCSHSEISSVPLPPIASHYHSLRPWHTNCPCPCIDYSSLLHAWPAIAIYGMAMHGHAWPYMAMHGHAWPCHIWLWLAMHAANCCSLCMGKGNWYAMGVSYDNGRLLGAGEQRRSLNGYREVFASMICMHA